MTALIWCMLCLVCLKYRPVPSLSWMQRAETFDWSALCFCWWSLAQPKLSITEDIYIRSSTVLPRCSLGSAITWSFQRMECLVSGVWWREHSFCGCSQSTAKYRMCIKIFKWSATTISCVKEKCASFGILCFSSATNIFLFNRGLNDSEHRRRRFWFGDRIMTLYYWM